MFLMGDEVRRTQHGNNNAYCQDNEANWFDWGLLKKHADVHRFVKLLVARRLLRHTGPEHERLTLTQLVSGASKSWHGVKLNQPDWSNHSHSVAFSAELQREGLLVYFIFNSYWGPLDFELPQTGKSGDRPWRRWIDTSLNSPQDIVEWQAAPAVQGGTYQAGPRSVIVLWANQ
jgi:glycogen operon protein